MDEEEPSEEDKERRGSKDIPKSTSAARPASSTGPRNGLDDFIAGDFIPGRARAPLSRPSPDVHVPTPHGSE